jgi:uncharacterized protein YfaS (alpha-2-macroglobulin family)
VLSRTPSQAHIRERRPTIHLVFDRAMDQESIAAALAVEPAVPLDLHWKGTRLIITPREPLAPGAQYEFALTQAATGVDGIPLDHEYRWTYWLDDLIAHTDWPAREDDHSTPLLIRFNYPMDAASVQQTLSVRPAIPGDLIWNGDKTIAVLTPTVPLPNETAYTIRFGAGLRDANGDTLSPPDPLHFTTPPPILAVYPNAGSTAHPASIVRVTFDRLMDPTSTEAAFSITPAVDGTFEWEETTLAFQAQNGYLDENTTYTVSIGATATGQDGEPILDAPYSWTFTTAALEDIADFGWGPNAQVVDADGRRAVQFELRKSSTSSVLTFELYRLNLTQFLDRYSSGFKGVAGEENLPISLEGATLAQRWQVDLEAGSSGYGGVRETTIPADAPPGLYILNLNAGHINDQLILLLTRNVIALKQAEGQIVAWVSDINGNPRPGVEVGVYARNGQLLGQGYADQDGVYRTEVARDPQPLIAVARDGGRDGDDVTATGLSNEWLSQERQWWGWWEPAPAAPDWAVYAYTDRPIYRPGQTVYFKAIVRRDDDAALSVPAAGTPVTVRIRDARDNVVQTFQLAANSFGTVNGEFHLAEGAMLGEYAVEVVVDGESHRQVFKVQDYRKPDYQVSVTTDAATYIEGEPITVDVDARYFFGQPVAAAHLVIRQYELGEWYWWDESEHEQVVWFQSYQPEIEGVTGADGRFAFTLDATLNNHGWDYDSYSSLRHSTWGIEVTADDGSHQTVSSFVIVKVFNAAERLSLDTGGYFHMPGQPFTIHARAAGISGEPVSGRALRLELRRYSRTTYDYTTVAQALDLTTGADGAASLPFTIAQAGYYQLHLTGRDRLGNALEYDTWVYAFSDASQWAGSTDSALSIAADRESYAPGDTARLLIESTFSGPALLTFERGTTRREMPVTLTAPLTVVDVPIQPDDAPNIFVTVNAWNEQETVLASNTYSSLPDSRLHTTSVELHVPVTDKTLTVTITPDRTRYAPRDQATFTVRVTNGQGQPVSAEISLALVDEAIFALSDELSGPIFDAFYHERDLVVRTYDGMALFRYLGGAEGGGGGDGGVAGNPRSDFPDTAIWLPTVQTDANGEAVLTLTLPDSLTSWRLTARAVTADTQVGEAFVNVVTQQEIVVRPLLPRSLTAGDRVEISAIVHNYSERGRRIAVSIQVEQPSQVAGLLTVEEPLTQTVQLLPGEQAIVGWQASAVEAGEAQVTVWASPLPTPPPQAGEGDSGDAVRLTVPIRPLAVPEVDTQIGQFSGEFTTMILLPSEALGLSTLRIELSRSIAGSLLTGLEYLTGYPYGCVEQTMSRALPNAVVGRAFHQLGIGNPRLQADLPPMIHASVQRLYGFQHNDGGWGWWYDDASHDYQTAWVVFGLTVTAQAGYEVDPAVIERGVAWLREHLNGMDIRTHAYALYSMALAGHGDTQATHALIAQASALDPFSQAALALALHELGAADEARQVLDILTESAVVMNGMVYWPQPTEDGHYYDKTMASSTRSTALALSAFVHIAPDSELEPGIVRWLMSQRHEFGWGSTNETSFAILALTDHLLALERATAETTYAVELNSAEIASGLLGPGEPAVSLSIPAGQMQHGDNTLRIRQEGGGRLYYVVSNRVYLPQERIAAAGGVRISRAYLDAESGLRIQSAMPGQLVQVRLTVDMPDNGFYVIVEDNLPGGLEALNEALNTTSHEASAYDEPYYYWQEYGYNYKEVRGERVSFFVTEMDAGRRTFTYVARATRAGEFIVLPTEVYEMTTWGRSASSRFTVTETTP